MSTVNFANAYIGVRQDVYTHKPRRIYALAYNVQYLADSKTPAIALSLPKREKPYRSSRIFPFFTNLLPEGSNRKAICAEQILSDSVNASDCQLKEPSGYWIFLWSFCKRLTI